MGETPDKIESLPMDHLPPSEDEKTMIQWIYHKEPTSSTTSSAVPIGTAIRSASRLELRKFIVLFFLCLVFVIPKGNDLVFSLFPFFSKIEIFWWIFKAFLLNTFLFIGWNISYLQSS